MPEKDRILEDLKRVIRRDSAWLTVDDQFAIERKIDELDGFIKERYQQHGKPECGYP